MPLMMDDDDGLDALFGDGPLDDAPSQLPTISIDPKGLQQAVDDQCLSGASQYVKQPGNSVNEPPNHN